MKTSQPKDPLQCKCCGVEFKGFRHDSERRPLCKECLSKKDNFWKQYVYGIEEMLDIREKYFDIMALFLQYYPEQEMDSTDNFIKNLETIFKHDTENKKEGFSERCKRSNGRNY